MEIFAFLAELRGILTIVNTFFTYLLLKNEEGPLESREQNMRILSALVPIVHC